MAGEESGLSSRPPPPRRDGNPHPHTVPLAFALTFGRFADESRGDSPISETKRAVVPQRPTVTGSHSDVDIEGVWAFGRRPVSIRLRHAREAVGVRDGDTVPGVPPEHDSPRQSGRQPVRENGQIDPRDE